MMWSASKKTAFVNRDEHVLLQTTPAFQALRKMTDVHINADTAAENNKGRHFNLADGISLLRE